MTGVVERLEQAHGIKVDTLDPFNEPNTDYWGTTLGPDGEPVGGRQEGAHIGPRLQQAVIEALSEKLGEAKTHAVISAMDETNPTTFARNWESYAQQVRAVGKQLNVHTYGTSGRTTARDVAKAADKPLWMSEVGGDWGDGQDFESIRPGDRLVAVNDTQSAAAISSGRKAAVVHVNDSASAREITLDLSRFGQVSPHATVTPVVTDADSSLEPRAPVKVSARTATVTVPAESVTTLLVRGVSGVARDAMPVQAGREYHLTGVASDKSLDVADDGKSTVIRTTDDGDAGQRWLVEKDSRGFDNREEYVLRNQTYGQRLAVHEGQALLEGDRGRPGRAARWILSTTGDGTHTFVNVGSGRLLDVVGAGHR